MAQNIEMSTFRIISSGDGQTTGLGIFMGNRIAISCARSIEAVGAKPGDRVNVQLYSRDEIEAEVIDYWPRTNNSNVVDGAILRFTTETPPEIIPVQLGGSVGSEGHTFSTFGYPEGLGERLIRARGQIYGLITQPGGRKLLQLSSKDMTIGFGGAPISDEITGRVVGMLESLYMPEKDGRMDGLCFAIPTETLLEALSPLLPDLQMNPPQNISLPQGFEHYARLLPAFLVDHPSPERNIFLVMRFKKGDQYRQIYSVLRKKLSAHGFELLRADDKDYTGDLWENVCLYMLGCKYAIVVFEEIDERELNPNVALELGFMFALNKRCLILKDQRMPKLPTDIIGKLYKQFDTYDIKNTLLFAVESWMSDLGI